MPIHVYIYTNTYIIIFYWFQQAQLDEQLVGLQTLTAARKSKLQESIKLHQYIRDVDEVLSWLAEKQAVAASDDYGKDFEHLLVNTPHSKTTWQNELNQLCIYFK